MKKIFIVEYRLRKAGPEEEFLPDPASPVFFCSQSYSTQAEGERVAFKQAREVAEMWNKSEPEYEHSVKAYISGPDLLVYGERKRSAEGSDNGSR